MRSVLVLILLSLSSYAQFLPKFSLAPHVRANIMFAREAQPSVKMDFRQTYSAQSPDIITYRPISRVKITVRTGITGQRVGNTISDGNTLLSMMNYNARVKIYVTSKFGFTLEAAQLFLMGNILNTYCIGVSSKF